jgi:hypothetical protein
MCSVSRLREWVPQQQQYRLLAELPIKQAPSTGELLLHVAAQGLLIAMTDAADFARRFLTVWGEYLTVLLAGASGTAIGESG